MIRYSFFIAAFVWVFSGLMSWQQSQAHRTRIEFLNNSIAVPQPAGESQREHVDRFVQLRKDVLSETVLRDILAELAATKLLAAVLFAGLGYTLARQRKAPPASP